MARVEVTGRKPGNDPGTEAAPVPTLAMSIPQFCEAHNISVGMYFKLRKQGLAPRQMRLGTRTLITCEDAATWRAERVAASETDGRAA